MAGTELAKAYVQIVPSADGIKGKLTSALGEEASSAGDAAGKTAGNCLGSTIKKIIAVAGIGTALKKAISEGANLEQSLGGIETLFKNSSDKVIANAKKAYMTAGLSANDYMESVTSFSASLLQGLAGDTNKAADIADMAMVDMSDNANKMGTDMQSIQNAYQGFAKQNYTMLDNLKLGYGGTKSEMERLLSDAEKFSGVKYDINNLSDVYEAIHVIQGELDITGTTAKEASTTLSGSFNSVKAAISNVLGSLALGEDLQPALNGLIDTAQTFLMDNLIPMVGNVLTGIVGVLPNLISSLLSMVPNLVTTIISIATTILSQLGTILPQIVIAIVEIVPQIVQALIDNIPALLKGAIEFLSAIIDAIPNILDALLVALPQIIETIVDGLVTAIPILIEGAILLFNGIIQAIPKFIPFLISGINGIITPLIEGLIDAIPELTFGAIELFMALVYALPDILAALLAELPNIISSICSALIDRIPLLLEAAITLFMAIIAAIPQIASLALTKSSTIVISIIDGIKSLPQKVLQVFEDLKAKFISKIEEIHNNAVNRFNSLKDKILTPMYTARDKIKEIIDKIKGFFSGVKLSFPNIKMPHFNITPSGWKIGDLLKGSIPKLGIDWYAKAMNNPMIMTSPTAFGVNSLGQIMAGGENGKEVVSGADTLMNMIASAVASQNGKIDKRFEMLLSLLYQYLPQLAKTQIVLDSGKLVGETAKSYDEVFGAMRTQTSRGW